jgi:hypothetical protein
MAALELFNTTLFNDANLVSYWRFEANSTDSKDSNNGTDTSISYSVSNGKFGQGAGFTAATPSKIVLTDAANLKQTGNFTVLAWVKTSTTGTDKSVFSSMNYDTVKYGGIRCAVLSTNKFYGFTSDNVAGASNFATITGSTTVTDNNWHFVAFVWDGSNLRLYVDGSSDATAVARATAPAYQATNYPGIGIMTLNAVDQQPFNGALDDIALFSRALSAAEILAHWNGTDGSALPANTSDSSAVTESTTVFVPGLVTLSTFDSSAVTEDVTMIGPLNLNVSDASAVTESTPVSIESYEVVFDSSTVTESTTLNLYNYVLSASVEDDSTVTDQSVIVQTFPVPVFDISTATDIPGFYPDSVGILENVSVSLGYYLSPHTADYAIPTDVVIVGSVPTVTVSESVSVSDFPGYYPDTIFVTETVALDVLLPFNRIVRDDSSVSEFINVTITSNYAFANLRKIIQAIIDPLTIRIETKSF